jgi:plasmid maintenance system antidote protein VapI
MSNIVPVKFLCFNVYLLHLPFGQQVVFSYRAFKASGEYPTYPSCQKVADVLGYSRKEISAIDKKLITAGLIDQNKKPNFDAAPQNREIRVASKTVINWLDETQYFRLFVPADKSKLKAFAIYGLQKKSFQTIQYAVKVLKMSQTTVRQHWKWLQENNLMGLTQVNELPVELLEVINKSKHERQSLKPKEEPKYESVRMQQIFDRAKTLAGGSITDAEAIVRLANKFGHTFEQFMVIYTRMESKQDKSKYSGFAKLILLEYQAMEMEAAGMTPKYKTKDPAIKATEQARLSSNMQAPKPKALPAPEPLEPEVQDETPEMPQMTISEPANQRRIGLVESKRPTSFEEFQNPAFKNPYRVPDDEEVRIEEVRIQGKLFRLTFVGSEMVARKKELIKELIAA